MNRPIAQRQAQPALALAKWAPWIKRPAWLRSAGSWCGDALRSKTDTALVSELLCKVLCHNICVLIQSMNELGVPIWFEP
jgi:hypothetical protein